MVLIERANRVKTDKLYLGYGIHYRLQGKDEYWYRREITDVLPESQAIYLDRELTPLKDIARMRYPRDPLPRILGGALLTFGVTLTIANTVSYLRKDGDPTALLYGVALVSGTLGIHWSKPKLLKFGKRWRLRAIEVPTKGRF